MRKNMFAAIIAALIMGSLAMACGPVDIEDGEITGGADIYGQPDPVYIEDFCGVSLEFGSTYIESTNEWMWNKVYIQNKNPNGAQVKMYEGGVPVFDSWVGFNANQCANIKGEDGYHHTGCPSDVWLEINSHVKLYVTYHDGNGQPVECPANGTSFDLDP